METPVKICEHDLCIYNQDNRCICKYVEIDCTGMCSSCILSNIPKDVQEGYKNKTLKRLGTDYHERMAELISRAIKNA